MCIFCKIVKGETPSYKIYEDDNTYAFLDIHPASDGHTLIVPRKHIEKIEDLTEEEHHAVFETVRRLVNPIQRAMDVTASNITVNNGPEAGQLVPHLHVHIIPRKSRTGTLSGLSRIKPRSEQHFKEIAEKIRREVKATSSG